MSDSQFCPICGYALKKADRQCGRCGEILFHESAVPEAAGGISWGRDYKIASIASSHGDGGKLKKEGDSTGMKRIDISAALFADRDELVADLRRQIDELTSMMEKQRPPSMAPANEPSPASHSGVGRRSDILCYLRMNRDPDFRKKVEKHISSMKRTLNDADSSPSNIPEGSYRFLSEGIVRPGLPAGSVVLFIGPSGSMKSSLAAFEIASMAVDANSRAIYLLLAEVKEVFMSRLKAMGVDIERLRIVDAKEIRENSSDMKGTWRDITLNYMGQLAKSKEYGFLAIDNINSLHSMVTPQYPRRTTYELFEWARKLDMTSIMIREGAYELNIRDRSADAYLADGILQFSKKKRRDGSTVPVFRVMKLRGAEIDPSSYALQLSSRSLRVIPSVAS